MEPMEPGRMESGGLKPGRMQSGIDAGRASEQRNWACYKRNRHSAVRDWARITRNRVKPRARITRI
jgi:hypothetical protein